MPRILKVIDNQWHKKVTIISIALMVVTSMASNCSNNPCMYGICVDDTSSSYRCYCIDGYTGINCEINWNDCWSSPCLNGGTCNDAIASYNCTCLDGFVGATCEQKYSECMNYPCQNNGTCLDSNGFMCQCLEGFSGEFCEIDASVCNNTVCKNFGECVEGFGLSFTCRCQNGWGGNFCEEDINECNLSPCQNGGLCINMPGAYTCACLFGFTGKDCDKIVVPCEANPCQNNAVCLFEDAQPICYCVPDYHGTFCESRYDDCESKSVQCHNGGTCVDGINNFTCSCPSRYAGDTCTLVVESTSIEIPTYFTDTYITEKIVPTEINTAYYTTEDTIAATETEKCLPNSCVTTDGREQPEHNTVQNSTDKFIETTQFTEIKDIFTLLPETRTEYDSSAYTNVVQDYTTTAGEKITLVPGFQDVTGATKIDETTLSVYTVKSIEGIYPNQTPESKPFKTTVETSFANDSTMQFTILDDTTTMQSIDATDFYRPSTTPDVNFANAPTTDAPSNLFNYSDAFESTSTPAIELDWTTKFTEAATATTVQGINDAVLDETITRNYTGLSVTESTDSNVTVVQVVTMLPSTIISEETFSRVITQADFTTPDNTDMVSSSPISTDSSTSETDFTTVTDFYKTTFGTDIKNEVTNVPSTTEYNLVHSCTRDQCANTSLCLENATRCDCSHWNNCRNIPNIENVAFNGKSYIRQKFVIENGDLSIFVRLKTRAKSGILIHALFDDERYILLYMETGRLKFQFSCGLQTMLFGELDSPINNGHSVDIETKFQYIVENISDQCSARLLINGTVVMSGEQLLQTHETVPQFARLHLGGIPVAFSQQFPQIVLGFVGCMSSLKVNDVKRDFVHDSAEAVEIEECNSFLCLSNPCQNFGACEETNGKISCKCFAGYSGETCERSICDNNPCHLGATCLVSPGVNFICVCPLGTHGLFCEEDTTIVQPSFSVFAPGVSSYMAYGVGNSLKDNMELKLRIIPRTMEQISLIAYMGQSGSKRDSSDHFSITYVRGYVMLTWDLGSGVRRIFTNVPLNARIGKVHTIQIGRRGRDSWLYVEGVGNVTGRTAGANTRLDVSPILYIGGHKSKYFEILPHDLPLHSGFSGCIYDIELRTDDNVFPVTMSSPATGRGVGECHRNECSQHSCKNGAVCLNYGPTYSCICMKDWTGADCSNRTNCTSSNPLCHKNKN